MPGRSAGGSGGPCGIVVVSTGGPGPARAPPLGSAAGVRGGGPGARGRRRGGAGGGAVGGAGVGGPGGVVGPVGGPGRGAGLFGPGGVAGVAGPVVLFASGADVGVGELFAPPAPAGPASSAPPWSS